MLPFLKTKKDGVAGITYKTRPSDMSADDKPKEDQGLIAAATDVCHAIKTEDYAALAKALRAAFDILDSEPHVEGEHLDEEQENE